MDFMIIYGHVAIEMMVWFLGLRRSNMGDIWYDLNRNVTQIRLCGYCFVSQTLTHRQKASLWASSRCSQSEICHGNPLHWKIAVSRGVRVANIIQFVTPLTWHYSLSGLQPAFKMQTNQKGKDKIETEAQMWNKLQLKQRMFSLGRLTWTSWWAEECEWDEDATLFLDVLVLHNPGLIC